MSLFGVTYIVFKGKLDNLINLIFSFGDLWILFAAISWALFSVFLINWKSKFDILERFTLMSFFWINYIVAILWCRTLFLYQRLLIQHTFIL